MKQAVKKPGTASIDKRIKSYKDDPFCNKKNNESKVLSGKNGFLVSCCRKCNTSAVSEAGTSAYEDEADRLVRMLFFNTGFVYQRTYFKRFISFIKVNASLCSLLAKLLIDNLGKSFILFQFMIFVLYIL